MPQHVAGQLSGVGGQGVVPAAQEGQRLRAEHHVDRRPRAGAEGDVAGHLGQAGRGQVTGRAAHPDRVLDDLRVDVHRVGGPLEAEQGLRVEHRRRPLARE